MGERTLSVLVTVGKPSTASENENVWFHELVSVDARDEELWAANDCQECIFLRDEALTDYPTLGDQP